jgi:hypothetical protein
MATPKRIGSSFQNEPLLLLACSSITHGAYAANLRVTMRGRAIAGCVAATSVACV